MLIQTKKISTEYNRPSKLKNSHAYTRTKTILVIQCDSCQSIFERDQGSMSKRRASNDYYHVCSNCNPKQFAQKRGVERRQIWKLSADSDINVSKI
jgi:hypothetical protein